MQKIHVRCAAISSIFFFGLSAAGQEPWTWERVRAQFEQSNHTLQAGKLTIDESKAQEIIAYLRPNPNLRLTADQIDPFGGGPPHGANLILLLPYKQQYVQQAVRVRDTVAYQHDGASLLDFLNAQSEYRNMQPSYVNLIGSYLAAASQLSLAVGREVMQ